MGRRKIRSENGTYECVLKEIVSDRQVTQKELIPILWEKYKIKISPASLSRLLQDHQIVKENGKWVLPQEREEAKHKERLKTVLSQHASWVGGDVRFLAIRTQPGFGTAVGTAIDDAMGKRIIGTISGRDVVLVLVQDKDGAAEVIEEIASYLSGNEQS